MAGRGKVDYRGSVSRWEKVAMWRLRKARRKVGGFVRFKDGGMGMGVGIGIGYGNENMKDRERI